MQRTISLAIIAILIITLLGACTRRKLYPPQPTKTEPDTIAVNITQQPIGTNNNTTIVVPKTIPTVPKINIPKTLNVIPTQPIIANSKQLRETLEKQQKWQKEQKEKLQKSLDKMQKRLDSATTANKARTKRQTLTSEQVNQRLDNYEYLISSVKNFIDIGIPYDHEHAENCKQNIKDNRRKAQEAEPSMTREQYKRYAKIEYEITAAINKWKKITSKT